jgi:hypothetical protein
MSLGGSVNAACIDCSNFLLRMHHDTIEMTFSQRGPPLNHQWEVSAVLIPLSLAYRGNMDTANGVCRRLDNALPLATSNNSSQLYTTTEQAINRYNPTPRRLHCIMLPATLPFPLCTQATSRMPYASQSNAMKFPTGTSLS